jgi:hypothetical protein
MKSINYTNWFTELHDDLHEKLKGRMEKSVKTPSRNDHIIIRSG